MTATTIQAGTSYHPTGFSDIVTRVGAYTRQFIGGVEEGREIAARYFELSQLSRAELARRGLNRPCELSDLMSLPYGHALGRH
jgi:hypothetical protein